MRYAISLSLAVTFALAAPAVLAAGVLAVSESDRYGRHLADAYGRALYLLEADGKGKSTCNDDCAQKWPPLRPPSGFPFAAGAAVRPHLIAIIGRRDGSPQVTYNGHPLYLYAGDRGSREASGQGLQDQWGRWYLVTPQGTKLQSRAHRIRCARAARKRRSASASKKRIWTRTAASAVTSSIPLSLQ